MRFQRCAWCQVDLIKEAAELYDDKLVALRKRQRSADALHLCEGALCMLLGACAMSKRAHGVIARLLGKNRIIVKAIQL